MQEVQRPRGAPERGTTVSYYTMTAGQCFKAGLAMIRQAVVSWIRNEPVEIEVESGYHGP